MLQQFSFKDKIFAFKAFTFWNQDDMLCMYCSLSYPRLLAYVRDVLLSTFARRPFTIYIQYDKNSELFIVWPNINTNYYLVYLYLNHLLMD